MAVPSRPYHHGDLRRVLLESAVSVIEQQGPYAMTLRGVARRAGVTHPAAAHHFGDKIGLLTAVATQGFDLLADQLESAWKGADNFVDIGVAYCSFAVQHRGHFDVMFRRDMQNGDDPQLREAMARAYALLFAAPGAPAASDERKLESLAGWALVHGAVCLRLHGFVDADIADDGANMIRRLSSYLTVDTTSESLMNRS